VRTTLIAATSVAILIAALAWTNLHAQTAAPPRAGSPAVNNHGIAVIDVTFILDNYNRLKQQTEVLKRAGMDTEDQLKKERDALARKVEKMKTYKVGSPDYKREEEEITKGESDWKLKVARQRGDFAERESKMYLAAYQDITKAVKAYADRNGISLVLRFNGAPIDPNNREAVQMEVFKMVMYYHKDIDITDPILAELNGRAGGGVASPPRSAKQPPPR
jgi:Skp family chaperone for outer membrane proteins